MLSRMLIVSFAILFCVLGVASNARAETLPPTARASVDSTKPDNAEFVPDEILVRFKPATARKLLRRGNVAEVLSGDTALDALSTEFGVRQITPAFASPQRKTVPKNLRSIFKIQLGEGQSVQDAVKGYRAQDNVVFAEPNYIAHALATPNDTDFAQQWGLTQINAPTAWDTTTGSNSVTIALVDSGMDKTHPDLSSKVWTNPGEVAGNSIDDDNNGFVDDLNGWNFVNGNNNPADDNGHGTLVAGIAGAASNNGIGVAGVCWQCKLMPVKVMSAGGVANYSDIASGVLYAAQKGAKVINLSLGGSADSQTLHSAIQAAANTYNVVVVAGAGNDNASANFYPAAYEEVLAVAGTDESDVHVSTSNYGAWVDVSAPGQNIHTTASGGGYATSSGTSLAAPFAAGLAGLLQSKNSTWSQALVRAQIVNTADNIEGLNPSYVGQLGGGRINAANAMGNPQPKLTLTGFSVNGTANGHPDPNTTAALQIQVSNAWLDATNVSGTLTETDPNVTISNATQSFGNIASGAIAHNSTAFSLVIGAVGYNHAIPLTLHLTADGGYSVDLYLTVTTNSSNQTVGPVTYTTNQTWMSNKTYIVNGNISVSNGATLTIQPGTVVKFSGNYKLWVYNGTLIADGTADQQIVFKSNTANKWDQILFDDGAEDAVANGDGVYVLGNILRHVRIENAYLGIRCNGATPYLSHVTVDTVDCKAGSTTVWLTDSFVDGAVTIQNLGDPPPPTPGAPRYGQMSANTHAPTSSGLAQIWRNTVNGRIFAEHDSTVGLTHVDGSAIHIDGTGTVLSNTVTGGQINVGPGSNVEGNSVANAPDIAIRGYGGVTIVKNRVTDSQGRVAVFLDAGLVQGNLIANNSGIGLYLGGTVTVSENTLTGNQGSAIQIGGGMPIINNNNLDHNKGQYDLEHGSSQNINAQSNWWGTTNASSIDARIFDINDGNPTLGQVDYSSLLTGPDQTAPGYVRNVTTNPASPVGIETVTFDVQFSRPMDMGQVPSLSFYSNDRGTWKTFNSSNSGLARDFVSAIAIDAVGNKWFGTNSNGLSVLQVGETWQTYLSSQNIRAIAIDQEQNKWIGTDSGVHVLSPEGTWQTYNTSNSGLANNQVYTIAIDQQGNKWFGTDGGGVSMLSASGIWQTYNTSNSGLAHNIVWVIGIDEQGNKWFGVGDSGVSVFRADTAWQTYNVSNSGLSWNDVRAIAFDDSGNTWFGTYGNGVSVLRGDGSWKVYTTSDSGIGSTYVPAAKVDLNGNKVFGTYSGVSLLNTNGTWQTFNPANSGLANDDVVAVAIDTSGNKWFGTFGGGVSMLYFGHAYPIANSPQWLSLTHYRATFDINTLIPKDTYVVNVASAKGTDGIEIAPTSDFTFQVDYAGGITDQTPPTQPTVTDDGAFTASTSQLHVTWSSSDAESAITQYQYAIGTSPSAADVVNWTTPNPATNTSVTKTGLTLTNGRTYYFAIKARNAAGLWSQVGVSDGITIDTSYKTPTPTNTPTGTLTPTRTNTPTRTLSATPTNTPTPCNVKPSKPTLVSPANGSTVKTLAVQLQSNPVPCASYYVVTIKNAATGTKVQTIRTTNTIATTKALTKSVTYKWQFKACNALGCTPSVWWTFKVGAKAKLPNAEATPPSSKPSGFNLPRWQDDWAFVASLLNGSLLRQ